MTSRNATIASASKASPGITNYHAFLLREVMNTIGSTRYVKNQNLGFTIPYTLNGDERNYVPDFIARIDDGNGPGDLLGANGRAGRHRLPN
ncbi:MAG: hypothetical protein KGJ99_07135 [Betaproteobacteria bacterium]|nr:hypothetical protein [Betaproteobacteria bacterium]